MPAEKKFTFLDYEDFDDSFANISQTQRTAPMYLRAVFTIILVELATFLLLKPCLDLQIRLQFRVKKKLRKSPENNSKNLL